MKEIGILQFNCGLANQGVSKPVLDAASPETHLVLAIQEPGFNRRTGATYCPKGYTLAFEATPTTKVCFMISKQLHIGQWSFQPYGRHVAMIRIQLAEHSLSIINVYNPRGNGPRIQTWESIQQAL